MEIPVDPVTAPWWLTGTTRVVSVAMLAEPACPTWGYELASTTGLAPSTVHVAVRRLVRAGMVEAAAEPGTRRELGRNVRVLLRLAPGRVDELAALVAEVSR